jgi:hypothetical protein
MLRIEEGEAPKVGCLLRSQAKMLLKQGYPYFVPRYLLRKRLYLEHVHGGEAQKAVTSEHPEGGEGLPSLRMLQIRLEEMLSGMRLRGVPGGESPPRNAGPSQGDCESCRRRHVRLPLS